MAAGVVGRPMVSRPVAVMAFGRVVTMTGRGVAVAVVTPGGMAVAAPGVVTSRMVSLAVMALGVVAAMARAVRRGGHRGVPGDVVGVVERVGGIAIGIVLGRGRAGEGDEHAGEGGQLGEGEFHGRSLKDRPL